jgi:hypothetical protein
MENNYNINFLCTYKSYNEDYYTNLCYQIQLLQVFNMIKYDETILQKNIENIYKILRENIFLKEIFTILENNHPTLAFFNNDKDLENLIYLQILFSYDYFDLFHKELINYFKDKNYNFQEIKTYILRENQK